jgi:Bardet-Biedl syndrome 1 protein
MADPNSDAPADQCHSVVGEAPGPDGPPTPPMKSVWLEAFNEPVAGITAYTPCVRTGNFSGDGDNQLVIADTDRKLKVRVMAGGEGLSSVT